MLTTSGDLNKTGSKKSLTGATDAGRKMSGIFGGFFMKMFKKTEDEM